SDAEFKEELTLSGKEVTVKLIQPELEEAAEQGSVKKTAVSKSSLKKGAASKSSLKKTDASKKELKKADVSKTELKKADTAKAAADSRKQTEAAAALSTADIKEGSIVRVELDDQGNAVSVIILDNATVKADAANKKVKKS
ncbi:MAG: hypothetical protein Q4B09_11775, partial [Lachnospiraceae bacterium]|nr:hypothetical protein [Lachnospiraceae bacterium]